MDQALLNTLFNGFMAIGTCLAAVFALIGLFSWRQQMYGQTNLDLAIKLGNAVGSYLNEIQDIRWKLTASNLAVMRKRYGKVRAKLDRSLTAPETVWGDEIARIHTELESCAGYLFSQAAALFRLVESTNTRFPTHKEGDKYTELSDIVNGYSDFDDEGRLEEDKLTTRLKEAKADIDRIVKPHLPKKSTWFADFLNWVRTMSPDLRSQLRAEIRAELQEMKKNAEV